MRYELGLSSLPSITVAEAKQTLPGFPKGLSAGVIIKALQDRRIPSVAVAFSEDRSVINEIEDRLTAMGAECYVVDHAFFPLRLISMVSERLKRSRYRNSEEDRSYVRIGSADGRSLFAALSREALLFMLQLALVEGLFVWRLSLKVGEGALMGAPWFIPQLALCALGLLGGNVLASRAHALRMGTIDLPRALPPMILSGCCAVAAVFLLNAGREEEIARRTITRPPSKPYAGLLNELRRRVLAGEVPNEMSAEAAADWDSLGEDTGDLLCQDRTGYDRSLRECLAGASWDYSLSCLPLPRPAGPPAPKVVWSAPSPQAQQTVAIATRHATPSRPWGITFELLHLSILVLAWMLSLVGLHFVIERRAKRSANLLPETAPETAPPIAQEGVAPATQQAELLVLQQQLAETQAALATHQTAIAQFRQQLGPAREIHEAQVAEIAQLRQQLGAMLAQRNASAQRVIPATTGAGQGLHAPPANSQGTRRRTGATVPREDGEHGSSYSLSGAQEERISPPKRKP